MLGINVEDTLALHRQLVNFIADVEDDWTSVKTQWEDLKACWCDRQYERFEPYFDALSGNYIKTLEECKRYSEFLSNKIQETKEIPELIVDPRERLVNSSIQNAANLAGIGLALNNPALVAVGIPSLLNSLNLLKNPGGGHGYQYQKERYKFLMALADDPKAPKDVRNWIKQEQRRIWNTQKLKASGKLEQANKNAKKNEGKKGREPKTKVRTSVYIRTPPGYDVGHRVAGIDMASNFQLELSSMNRAKPHIADALGLSPGYR